MSAATLLPLRLAWRNVFRQGKRTLVNLAALALGCAALVLLGGFVHNFAVHFREPHIHNWSGHLQIARRGYWAKGKAHPEQYLLPADPELQRRVVALPHVRAVMPRLEFGALLSTGETTITVIGQGLSPRVEADFAAGALPITAGSNLAGDDPREVVLGWGLARALGVKVGDRVTLLANTYEGSINGLDLRVRGIYRTGNIESDNYYFHIDLDQAQKLLGTSQVQVLAVGLDDTDNLNAFRARLAGVLAGRGDLEYQTWDELFPLLTSSLNWINSLFAVVRVIVLFIVVLSVVNTISQSIQERTKEIGTVLAIGSYRRGVLAQFMYEGALLSLLGGVLGVAGSYLLVHTVLAGGIHMPPPPGGTFPVVMSIDFLGRDVGLGMTATLLAALAGCAVPSWRAARTSIVESLRSDA